MGQGADAAIAMVLRDRREDALRALDPEYAARRGGSGPPIHRCRRHGPFDAADSGRNVADEGDSNRRNGEPQQLLQVEMPSLQAGLPHVSLLRLTFVVHARVRTERSRADFAGGETQEQHGPVKRAVRNTPARLLVETFS